MRHLRPVVCCTLLIGSVALGNTLPEVTNVTAVQRPHTALVDVTYDLFDADGDPMHVTLWYSVDGGLSWDDQCVTVWGDVGPGIMPGQALRATWDAGFDNPGVHSQQALVRVYAEDGGGVPDGFVYIPAGTFAMGSAPDEPGRQSDEMLHTVTLTRGFFMASHEVTEAWWAEVMDVATPPGGEYPKRSVSWDMAIEFCNALSVQEGLTPAYAVHGMGGDVTWDRDADGYRLPTEAEWEYACRAGTSTAFANGPITHLECDPIDAILDAMGWYCGNEVIPSVPMQVGQKQANAWGLYDMHGNMDEWVWDGYRQDHENLPAVDPVHDPGPGAFRVFRGGSWSDFARACRSATRDAFYPSFDYDFFGFRPVRTAP